MCLFMEQLMDMVMNRGTTTAITDTSASTTTTSIEEADGL